MPVGCIEFFYKYYVGKTPDVSKEIQDKTTAIIGHLIDSGISNDELLTIYTDCSQRGFITEKDIPRDRWKENNLIDPECFYMHPQLTLISAPPFFNFETNVTYTPKRYYEIKEIYTVQQTLDYAYEKLYIDQQLYDTVRDIGYITYLYKKYSAQLKGIKALDFILYLIDAAAENKVKSLKEITLFEEQELQILTDKINHLKSKNLYRIIWRNS